MKSTYDYFKTKLATSLKKTGTLVSLFVLHYASFSRLCVPCCPCPDMVSSRFMHSNNLVCE